MMQATFSRPRFPTVADYIDYVRESLESGRAPWEPATRPELEAVVQAFPHEAHRWLPTPEALDIAGLPEEFGKPVRLLPEAWRESFFETLLADAEFCRAVAIAQRGAL